MRSRPDVLVLGGGGVLGEAWMMGVLSGIEDGAGVDLRDCDAYLGTSAGSIVAAHLVAGNSPRRPSSVTTALDAPVQPDGPISPATAAAGLAGAAVDGLAGAAMGAIRHAGGATIGAGAVVAPLALGAAAPGGALLRALLLRGLPHSTDTLAALRAQVQAGGARFDGRLRVTAVERSSGRRVVFGSPRAPRASVAEAVEASCAVPWLFAAVQIAGRAYVDGGVWSPTNLDAAPAGRSTHVLCLNPTASLPTSHALMATMFAVARSAAAVESLALRRRGAQVVTVAPDAESAATMGVNFMASEPRLRVLSAGYRQGLALAANGR